MNRIPSWKNWLVEPCVTGIWAPLCAIAAVGVPTLIRGSLDGAVMGCASIPYVPFIVLAAIFLGWRYAVAVALVSAGISDALFMGTHAHLAILEGACDFFGVGGLLTTSALIIGFVEAARSILRDLIKEHTGGVVFSLRDGQAWASWYGHRAPVHLGAETDVAEMMQDFLAQLEFGKRLTGLVR
jgi:hypothetical protein